MHQLSSSFVLGYHGCDQDVAEKLLNGAQLAPSENDYDWLGHGVYFWEANPKRGLEFALDMKRRGKPIERPAVVGAVIDLGLCLDLTTSAGVDQVRTAFRSLEELSRLSEAQLPKNSGGPDRLRRELDCAVINNLHQLRASQNLIPVDTVKGVFVEGGPAYPGAGIHARTHVQVCVRHVDQVKGIFRVPDHLIQ